MNRTYKQLTNTQRYQIEAWIIQRSTGLPGRILWIGLESPLDSATIQRFLSGFLFLSKGQLLQAQTGTYSVHGYLTKVCLHAFYFAIAAFKRGILAMIYLY